jgi:hypothetical protein
VIPQKGQHVQCLLHGGGMVEGIVESWSETETVLRGLDRHSILIIHQTHETIALTKILFPKPEVSKSTIKEQLERAQHPTGDPAIDAANVQQLRQMVIEQEKKIVADKIKEHHLPGISSSKRYEDRYEFPQSFRKGSP